jgi:hypothetical protein
MLKRCAANRNRELSALPNVGPYKTLKFLALQGAPICIYIYIYAICRLRVKGFIFEDVYLTS